jgi:fimbrial isopeptide formation D2 family protein
LGDKKMERKTRISLMLAFLMIVSTFATEGVLQENYKPCTLCKPIQVSKTVWDDSTSAWADIITAEVGDVVKFNITITYEAYEPAGGYMVDNITVKDTLPANLIYILGNSTYQESYADGIYIYWNLSKDYGIFLTDGENVSIEFEAEIGTVYGEYENYVVVNALEHSIEWNWPIAGYDSAWVNVPLPDSTFEKMVKDTVTGQWTEETFQYVTEKITFKIELTYYGNYDFTDVKIIDYLPVVTEYAGNANITPTGISEDNRTIWWNLSESVEDGEPCVITFDALVTGSTGDCTNCGTNLATVTAIENETQNVFEASDTAIITSDYYEEPELSYQPNNINFGEQEQGWTGSETFEIWNSGQQELTYTISEDLNWIEINPTSGNSTGEHNVITVNVVNTEGMSGYYSGNIEISSNGGSANIFVSIFIKVEEPKLSYQPNNINFGEQEHGWTGSETFEIWNSGQQELTYTISEDLDWIEINPTSGSSTGEHDVITVRVVNTAGMSGYYNGNIEISSNGGSGSIFVVLYIIKEEVQIYVQINKKIFIGKVCAEIINTGDVDINYIEWKITVTGGLLNRINKSYNGTFSKPALTPGDIKTFCGGKSFGRNALKFRFGRVIITVKATGFNDLSEDTFEKVYRGLVLGRIILIRGEITQEE